MVKDGAADPVVVRRAEAVSLRRQPRVLVGRSSSTSTAVTNDPFREKTAYSAGPASVRSAVI